MDKNQMSYEKCKNCRWVEFIDGHDLEGNGSMYMRCQITDKMKELENCIQEAK